MSGFRDGWWWCLLRPKVTYELVRRQRRTIDQLRTEVAERTYEGNFMHSEITDLTRTLSETRSALAGVDAYLVAAEAGESREDASDAAQRAYDLTLWLERSARTSWVERRDEWVAEQRRWSAVVAPLARAASGAEYPWPS